MHKGLVKIFDFELSPTFWTKYSSCMLTCLSNNSNIYAGTLDFTFSIINFLYTYALPMEQNKALECVREAHTMLVDNSHSKHIKT